MTKDIQTQDMKTGASSKVVRNSPTYKKLSALCKLLNYLQHWFIPSRSAHTLSSCTSTEVVNRRQFNVEPEPCQLSYSCNFQNCQQKKIFKQDYQSYTCWWLNLFWNLPSPARNRSATSAVHVLAWLFLVHIYAWSGHNSRLGGLLG